MQCVSSRNILYSVFSNSVKYNRVHFAVKMLAGKWFTRCTYGISKRNVASVVGLLMFCAIARCTFYRKSHNAKQMTSHTAANASDEPPRVHRYDAADPLEYFQVRIIAKCIVTKTSRICTQTLCVLKFCRHYIDT